MDTVIAIPSHNRPRQLVEKSLGFLTRAKFPLERVFVFVDKSEIGVYTQQVAYYGVQLKVGAAGLPANRKCIQRFFPENLPICMMDDDITDLVSLRLDWNWEDKTKKQGFIDRFKSVENLSTFLSSAFEHCRRFGSRIWGVHPVLNPHFMKKARPVVSNKLNFIYGCFFGVFNTPSLSTELSLKDDFERSLLFYEKFQNTVRFHKFSPVQNYQGNSGGLASLRSRDLNNKEVHILNSRFPNWVRVVEKKDGWMDIRLKG